MMILPSLASADQMNLQSEIEKVRFIGNLHFDIEDGNFVPNITFGLKTIKCASEICRDMKKDAHLMVTDPEVYIEPLASCGFEKVAFHWESAPYPSRLIEKIHKYRMQAGIAINPRTQIGEIEDWLERVEYILLMSSEPDGAGEQFQRSVLKKAGRIREECSWIPIIVDGGVNKSNYAELVDAGVSGVVLGRAIFQADNVSELVKEFLKNQKTS